MHSRNPNALAIMDQRTSSGFVPEPTSNPEFSHLHHRTYKEGLISLLYSSKDANVGGASGSGGNMRSSLSFGQLLQTIMAIGPFGSIIPNEDCMVQIKRTKGDSAFINLRYTKMSNPTEILVNSAFGMMSLYCEMLRRSWTKR